MALNRVLFVMITTPNFDNRLDPGIAYARLGFYQRSADILQNALPITPDPTQQANLQRLLTAVQKQLAITQTNHD